MRYEISLSPSYAMASVQLQTGEALRSESGAMVAMSPSIDLESQMRGGLLGSLKRAALGGESFFQSTFTANRGAGEVLLAPQIPGDIIGVELSGEEYIVQSGSYLASDMNLELDTKFGGLRSLFAGEGFFWVKVSGRGTLLVSSFGGIYKKTLAPGERYIVDNGHIVAFPASVQYEVRKAAKSWISTLKSGEGLVCEYTGPGEILLQSRSASAFAAWVASHSPSQSSG